MSRGPILRSIGEVSEISRSSYSQVEQSTLDFSGTQLSWGGDTVPGQHLQLDDQILKDWYSQVLSGFPQALCLTHLYEKKVSWNT